MSLDEKPLSLAASFIRAASLAAYASTQRFLRSSFFQTA